MFEKISFVLNILSIDTDVMKKFKLLNVLIGILNECY